jgi:two-component system, OmpR family, phosphate regulon sensor histidine kinase PhoR
MTRVRPGGYITVPSPQHQAPCHVIPETAKAFLEALPLPCLVIGRDKAVAFTNSRARDLFQNSYPGQPIAELLLSKDVLEAVMAAQTNERAMAIRFALPGSITQWFEAHIAPLRLDGEAACSGLVLATLSDLTQQQRIERMRADFVANASHELRTPLASLLGFIETLQGPARDDAEARERFLAVMKTQAERMSRLINDLLSLSRIEVSEHLRPNARVDLCEVIAHVADSLAALALDSGVDLVLDLPPQPLTVFGERDELVRVFENLVENAIKYGASGGRVEVEAWRAEPSKPQAVVVVCDFGPGIAPEHVPRLTERFYRVDIRESRQKGGTGLGLALVKHILNRHRGALDIVSELGRGSTFTVRLGLADADASAS